MLRVLVGLGLLLQKSVEAINKNVEEEKKWLTRKEKEMIRGGEDWSDWWGWRGFDKRECQDRERSKGDASGNR